MIANDKVEWSKHCPTFHMVLSKIRDYFRMDIAATRLNWYRDSTEWKPFHHDAAAIKVSAISYKWFWTLNQCIY